MKRFFPLLLAGFSLVAPASAAVPFADWDEQRFSLFSGNDWMAQAASVSVTSQGTVSMLWTALPENLGTARSASWTWSVQSSVPPTRLDLKGGDDRNLSLYFIFMPEDIARANRGASIRRLIGIEQARVLMYVWGGDHERGEVLPSPYLGARGKTVALRQSGTGSNRERIDLGRDYRRAFGGEASSLVGLALSADSDDTDSIIRATLRDLDLR
jgi:hypothetical protein